MKTFVVTVFAIAFAALLQAEPAGADSTRTWVASTGSDVNNSTCSFDTPCRSIGAAYAKAGVGGEVNCKDAATYSGIAITHSITINCEAGAAGNGAVSDPAGVGTVSISIGAADTVVLRGFNLDFLAITGGIDFNGSGTLIVDRLFVTNALSSGIFFRPNGPAKLVVSDSTFTTNGSSSTGAAILIRPGSGGTAQVVLERVNASRNTFGVAVDGSNSTGGINMTIADSVLASNVNDGLIATTSSGGAPIGVFVKNSKIANNQFGIRSLGTNVTVRVDGSGIVGNGTGLTFGSGGKLLSTGTNVVEANGVNGAFSGVVSLK